MAYRCQSCNLLCSVEQEELYPEFDVDDEGVVTGSLELQLNSACCGDTVATAESEIAIDTGLVLTFADGSEFQVTIVKVK